MINSHLFLFGGSPPFSSHLGKRFSELAMSGKGKVAILFVLRDGWEQYMPRYTNELEQNGISDFVYIPLSEHNIDINLEKLNSCTGVIIGGGETELYRKYIVDTEIGHQLKRMYEQGVPIAGFSAGALISPENCVIPPIDNSEGKHLYLKGLGLIKECVVCVHFTEWNEEKNLKIAMSKLGVPKGYGIDDEEGLYFIDGNLKESEGDNYLFVQ
ncbi:Type 1 glutamine amidotransferase-like domain-containing protein [Sutcliffiella horikoshii]|uniref:Type 1 glutamine amidotransferase-like domain-containing protein n=1 Tax=Sutcliffiella horikoshii TaxID=79883 RepID=UPI001CFE9394|nr:Type 1 glutamine amidotransferase-like domain-containing protein [Sutcliffiella horikoshii]